MSKLWEELKESGIINEKIQEALEQKLAEVKENTRKELEESIRAEYSARFEKDKGVLVTAMDKFLKEALEKELTEFQEDRRAVKEQKVRLEKAIKEARDDYRKKIKEHRDVLNKFVMEKLRDELKEFAGDREAVAKQRVKLSRAILEARKTYETKLREHMDMMQKFMMKKLHEEIKEFYEDKKQLEEQKAQTSRKLHEHRKALNEQFTKRMATLEKFVLGQLRKELLEFKEDKDALVEQRVKLAAEAKQKIAETQRQFIKKAAKLVEGTIEEQIRKEMVQFRDDIKFARENHFGRKIFEAFAAEFMSSYLSEGTQVKKAVKKVEELQQKLDEATKQLEKQSKLVESAKRKIALAEDKAKRQEILSSLLSPLKRDKRAVMAELLENVKTENLQAAYNKYLPSVLSEGQRSQGAGTSRKTRLGRRENVLTENKTQTRSVNSIKEATGNRVNRVSASVQEENQEDQELQEFLKIALPQGVNK